MKTFEEAMQMERGSRLAYKGVKGGGVVSDNAAALGDLKPRGN